jgi:5-methylthioadenosine/S-adenosylhomocysteine deaminase
VGTLIREARVLTMDDRDTEYPNADILIHGKTIRAIGPNLSVPQNDSDLKIIKAQGLLAMPGLVNAHIHSPGNFMKGALDDTPLEIFMLYEVPPMSDKPPSKRLNYVRTMLGAMEMLKLGVTAVHDDAFHIPVPTPESIDGIMEAYADSGMRAAVTLDQPNVVEYEKYPFLYDLLPESIRQQMASAPILSTAELLSIYRDYIKQWHGVRDGRISASVSCSAPQRVTVDYFHGLSELSRSHNLPFKIHILETKLQRVLGQEKHGKSFIQYVNDLGILDERVVVVHSIWVDEEDMNVMARSGCCVAHNPISNLKIGSGVMPFGRLRNHGIPICLGTDEATVDDTANMWGVAKMAGLIHKIADPDYRDWPKASEILEALTRGGTRSIRMGDRVGMLAPGYEADLILVDLNSLAFTPLNDLRRQLVFCENGSSVVLTMVAGKVVAENGKVLTADEDSIKQEIRELMAEYHSDFSKRDDWASKLEPYYREMYFRAAARDVGMSRWAGPMKP